MSIRSVLDAEKLAAILPDYGAAKAEDLFALIGYGKISAKQILVRIAPDGATLPAEDESRITSVVKRVLGLGSDAKLKVRGFDDLLVYRAKCCNPIRGEEIIGYITRGKGVAVHSKNCPNVQNLLYDAARKIEVEWAGVAPQAEAYAVPLTIVSENRAGILAQIAAVVAEVGSNIVHVEAKTADERGTIDLVVEIPDMKHLERVLSSIRRIDGVYEVIRTTRTVNQAK
jgi:guanosine-3',5'-bis(diphosphate) 3'-pyrophosphohydrolase